jgi:hypothetical protein
VIHEKGLMFDQAGEAINLHGRDVTGIDHDSGTGVREAACD